MGKSLPVASADRDDADEGLGRRLFERFVRPPDFKAELSPGEAVTVQQAPTRKWQVRRCYVNSRDVPTEAHVYTFYSEQDARAVASDLRRRIIAAATEPSAAASKPNITAPIANIGLDSSA